VAFILGGNWAGYDFPVAVVLIRVAIKALNMVVG